MVVQAARRYFTPDEANTLLEALQPQLDELVGQIRLARSISGEGAAGGREVRAEAQLQLHRLKQQAQTTLDGILATGVYVKGLEPTLLDFPALMDGQEVLLCWREGEAGIAHWHPLHTGYAGRKPLDGCACWEWCS